MTSKSYLTVTCFLFLVFAMAHLLRVIFALPVRIDVWTIPVWVSWLPFAGATLMSIWAFWLTRAKGESH
jgi:hypothetical protein